MPPIRRVTFLDANGKPIEPQPSRLAPVEREVEGDAAGQDRLVEFGDSRAPAPRHASVQTIELPAQVGAAQELTRLRRSNELRERPRRRRRLARRGAKRARPARKTGKASKARTKRATRTRTTRTTRTRRTIRR